MGYHPDLKGKVAIVTGGGKGIGRAIALGLGTSGAKVVTAARSSQEIEAVAEEIRSLGGDAMAKMTDLTSSEQIEALVQFTLDAYGGIDILVNNAARSFLRPLIDLREDGFDKVFSTNVKAPFLLSRAAAKIMMGRGGAESSTSPPPAQNAEAR